MVGKMKTPKKRLRKKKRRVETQNTRPMRTDAQRDRSARLTDEIQASVQAQAKVMDDFYTPDNILNLIKVYFGDYYGKNPFIGLDPANAFHNPTGARRYYTEKTNGLRAYWNRGGSGGEAISGEGVRGELPPPGIFCNPPHENLGEWLLKIYEESTRHYVHLIVLLPGWAPEREEYFLKHVFNDALVAICAVNGGGFLYLFNGSVPLFGRIMQGVGTTVPVLGCVYPYKGPKSPTVSSTGGGIRPQGRKKKRRR